MKVNGIRTDADIQSLLALGQSGQTKRTETTGGPGADASPVLLPTRADVVSLAADTAPPVSYTAPVNVSKASFTESRSHVTSAPVNDPADARPKAKAQSSAAQLSPAPAQSSAGPAAKDAQSNAVYTQADLDRVLASFGARTGDQNYDPTLDFNADGAIDFGDLNHVLSNFSTEPTAPTPPATPTPPVVPTEPTAPAGPEPFTVGDLTALIGGYGLRAGQQGFDPRLDVNGNGELDFGDLNHVLSQIAPGSTAQQQSTLEGLANAYGLREGDEGYDVRFDLDQDGLVGFSDLNRLLNDLFET